jgi:hypothetical protein
MPTLNESRHAAEFIVSEANGSRSRDGIVIAANLSAALVAGQVLGRRTAGTATAAAAAGNTGNGAFGTVTNGVGVQPGVYRVICVEPAANGGVFTVEDPQGVTIGRATVGVAFSNQIGFTIADGATDFVSGDSFNVTVAAGTGQFQALDLAATNGADVPAGILYDVAPIQTTTQMAAAIVRDAEVNGAELTWPVGITDPQRAAAIATLATRSLIVR